MEKSYTLPTIAWLRATDYLHGWLQSQLGCAAMVGNQKIVCVQHLEGAKQILKMETREDTLGEKCQAPVAMSAKRYNCVTAGLQLDEQAVGEMYGVKREELPLYVPIEVPKMCTTSAGVLRPWTLNTSFGHKQAGELLRLLREEFWKAVAQYDRQYAEKKQGRPYPAIDMIEAFCRDTQTSDIYAAPLRREWQRRQKRIKK